MSENSDEFENSNSDVDKLFEDDPFDLDRIESDNGVLIIGDIHFRSKHVSEAKEFIEKCVGKAEEYHPDLIVLLGDILDTHEVARAEPYNLALELIGKLSVISPMNMTNRPTASVRRKAAPGW